MTSTTNFDKVFTTLSSQISSASKILATASAKNIVYPESKTLAGLQASYAYYSNQEIIATATQSQVIQSASSIAAQASGTLQEIYESNNLYGGMTPSKGGNLALAIIMGIFFVVHSGLGLWFKQWWFGTAFFCGCGLEMAGYIGRTLSNDNYTILNYFLVQIICLTIAPAFIMGGIYILLTKFIMIYGIKFALVKPIMLYSYIFIFCDVVSLVIQAAGGGIAAVSLVENESSLSGTHVMVAGLAFQVFSMSIYIFLYLHYFYKIKFFNKREHLKLESEFNPKYAELRSKRIFQIFPFVVFLAVIFVYVRCIYRVVELAEGWDGFLITHEVYFMILDALMMGLAIIILIFFHPGFVFGRNTKIPVKGLANYNKSKDQEEQAIVSSQGDERFNKNDELENENYSNDDSNDVHDHETKGVQEPDYYHEATDGNVQESNGYVDTRPNVAN
ncbi:Sphingoid long-chain base transporter [Wickerhamomyces ciferrii]|uniref:Sphingoid long-chain base transporter RSB1 n=1 Tax=Wickerhamomyces ciferrii (strain ATCC 14091 / BCRC 22168 / CBS 111 / JCM 3599 / NBRC 0793 / NRRL Y-1031 F-60-10) TaxID=1206466 RepID=K0KI81_WICCF|nr:Sphingoid long-chain base transporter [Wickerhamomyces ciferrii]CCH41872.1 Sphingoid long-chain base transporter [Wickerhamomyces ciferrii]